MTTSKIFSSPKNAYSKVSSSNLSSSFNGDSDDRLGFFPDGANYYIISFHLLVSIGDYESSKALISSIDRR